MCSGVHESKNRYIEQLRNSRIENPTAADLMYGES